MKSLAILREALFLVPERLAQIRPAKAAVRPAPGKWSPKQELGHLLDSAVNNHQRIVRAQLEDEPAMPGYDGDRWVELHAYQNREWPELISLWVAFNRQLLAAGEPLGEAASSRTCTVAGSEPMTIQFILDDYVKHMLHHLEHIGINLTDVAHAMA